MNISSRTPNGKSNWCAVCKQFCRIEPSCFSVDAPCPTCGQLLWFFEEDVECLSTQQPDRPKRIQQPRTRREPRDQAKRLIARLIKRAEVRFGFPGKSIIQMLSEIVDPIVAERLLSLLYLAKDWKHLLQLWSAENVDRSKYSS